MTNGSDALNRNESLKLSPMEIIGGFPDLNRPHYGLALHDESDEDEDEGPCRVESLGDDSEETHLMAQNVPMGGARIELQSIISFSFLTMSTLSATVFTFVPFVLFTYNILFDLTDRWFFSFPLALLRLLHVSCIFFALSTARNILDIRASCCFSSEGSFASSFAVCQVICWSFISFFLHGLFVPSLFGELKDSFFVEVDGTIAIEWHDLDRTFLLATRWSRFAAVVDLFVALFGLCLFYSPNGVVLHDCQQKNRLRNYVFNIIQSFGRHGHKLYQGLVFFSLIITIAAFVICGMSSYTYLFAHEPPANSNVGHFCDPIDETECLMPFPSAFFTIEDNSSATKRRVNISAEALSTMYKGGQTVNPSFLNELDGFSTIGPIIFYREGLKEGGGLGANGSMLCGPEKIDLSNTSKSLTLLVDIEQQVLVHHFSEIDSMNPTRPAIVMQPAAPLRHNSTYAVALINAFGANEDLLPASPGLLQLLSETSSVGSSGCGTKSRSSYFKCHLIPALREAAPWVSALLGDGFSGGLQMLFDFNTVSAASQQGLTRSVRDAALQQVDTEEWGSWGGHNVRVVKKVEGNCKEPGEKIARILHIEIDVPWFLHINSPRHRASSFNSSSLLAGLSEEVMPVKFIILVPCSLVKESNPMNLAAIVDFGHSFLYSREELLDSEFLHKIANENGYLLVASNWRGMSDLDVPVILRTFVAKPNLFRAARDNLIQGYADKAVIQHFCRNGLLEMNFLKFRGKQIDTAGNTGPKYIFYGISQGGILGAAYSSLMGSKLIDGSILGSPGTPFALLMSRSDIFPFYRELLLLHLYNLRHVRIIISLMQMAWDSVEGVLAPPAGEKRPRTLIQTGLGDSTVTTLGAEILARAFNASAMPLSPRDIFGVPVSPAVNSSSNDQTSVISEVLYKREYSSLPSGNNVVKRNSVHWCTRLDASLQAQLVEFIASGKIINPCVEDECIRPNATC